MDNLIGLSKLELDYPNNSNLLFLSFSGWFSNMCGTLLAKNFYHLPAQKKMVAMMNHDEPQQREFCVRYRLSCNEEVNWVQAPADDYWFVYTSSEIMSNDEGLHAFLQWGVSRNGHPPGNHKKSRSAQRFSQQAADSSLPKADESLKLHLTFFDGSTRPHWDWCEPRWDNLAESSGFHQFFIRSGLENLLTSHHEVVVRSL